MKKLIALLLAALILFTGCDNSILDRFLNNDVQDNVVEDLNNNTNSDDNTDQKPNDQTPDDQKPDDQKPDDQPRIRRRTGYHRRPLYQRQRN